MEGSVCVLMGKWGELTTIVGKSLGKRRLGAERGGVKPVGVGCGWYAGRAGWVGQEALVGVWGPGLAGAQEGLGQQKRGGQGSGTAAGPARRLPSPQPHPPSCIHPAIMKSCSSC